MFCDTHLVVSLCFAFVRLFRFINGFSLAGLGKVRYPC